MLKEVRFTFRHEDCWLLETTQRYPSVTLLVSAVYQSGKDIHIDLLVHAPSKATIDSAFREWSRDGRIRKISKLYDGPKGVRYHVSYSAAKSIYPYIIQHTPVSLGAVSMANGIEYYSILGESEDVRGLLGVLGKEGTIEVQSIKDLVEIPEPKTSALEGTLLGELTDKQIEALLFAHSQGYYTWPRVSSASELAERLNLSSAAFLDHLRRAEAKAVDLIVKGLRVLDPARVEAIKGRLQASSRRAGPATVKVAGKGPP